MQVNATCCNHANTTAKPGLTVRDNVIDTGRYEIVGKEHELWIKDRHSNTWVKLWGDPHGVTSDGDKFQFHKDNLTFDLLDGTKVTVQITPPNKKGLAFLDSVAVIKGNEAIEMKGLSDGKPGVKIGEITNDVARIDKLYDDGTVLRPGFQIDDLFFGDGTELIGGDKSAKFGEWVIDGKGGTSKYDFTAQVEEMCNHAKEVAEASGVERPPIGASITEVLLWLYQVISDKAKEAAEELKDKGQQFQAQKTDAEKEVAKKDGVEKDSAKDEEPATEVTEQDLAVLGLRLQELTKMAEQIFTMASNVSESSHRARMVAANNMR